MEVSAEPPDAAAEFERFYTASGNAVLRQLILLTGDLAEAEDVTQEAFERAWLGWQKVRSCDSPEAWVRTVARRLAVSRWRRTKNAAVAWLRRDPAPQIFEIDADHLPLMNALLALPQRQRVAIVLHHLADLSVAQVAQETGSSVAAVKQQLARGRSAMALLLAENEPTGVAQKTVSHPEEK